MEDLKIRLVHPSYNLNELLFFNYSIQKYVDTLIIGANGSLRAHSTILEKNDVLKGLLTAQKEKEEKVVNLPQFTIEVLRVIIEFLYRGDSRYFQEIEREVKTATTYFFETPKTSDLDCVEIKPIVPVLIVSDSDDSDDNYKSGDSPQFYRRNVSDEINIQQVIRTKSPPRKRRILDNAELDSIQNGRVSKKKKDLLQSKSVIRQSNNNESIVQLSPLKRLSQISVSQEKELEASQSSDNENILNSSPETPASQKRKLEALKETNKKDLFPGCRATRSNKRHVNPFASLKHFMYPENSIELSNQEEPLHKKNTRVNIIDHTILESKIIEEPATQSPEFLFEEPVNILDLPTIRTVAVDPVLAGDENPSTNVSQELFHTCTSTSQVSPKEQTFTMSKDQSIKSSVLTNEETSNKSDRPITRNRYGFDSTDDENFLPSNFTSKRIPKWTTSKKSVQDDKIKTKNCILDLFKKPIHFQCNICVLCMKEVDHLQAHLDKKHRDCTKMTFRCSQCSHKFFYKSFLIEHLKNCTNESKCICSVCKPY